MRTLFRALAAAAISWSLYAAPTVTKVEPPNWWMGLSLKPVRLLVHGLGLSGARLQCADTGLSITRVSVNQAGTYLFADVAIVKPGKHTIRVLSPSGSTKFDFEVLPVPQRAGRFQGFSPDDLIYLIMPDRFANGDPTNDDPPISKGLFDRSKPHYYHGGDFQGIVDHLPYLKDLGVTAMWINPIYDNVNHLNYKETSEGEPGTDYHGYGAVDFYGVEEHFGDLNKFRKLVDAAHASGIKVILDMVENHTGPYHPWVADPPTPTWFHGTEKDHIKEAWQGWTLISPKFSPELQKATLDGWFADFLPDLNQDDAETARYLIQNTLWWIASTGIDGIRQDTLIYVPRKFWRDWMAAIKRDFPRFRVVGEAFDADPALTSFFQGGKARFDGVDSGVDSVFDFPQYFAIRSAFAQGKPVEQVASVVAHDFLYPDPADLVTFLGLHDVERFMNEPGATYEGLELAFTYLMTSRGIPMIYYGDEIGMPGGKDPDDRRDFPGGWTGDAKNKFEPAGRTGEEHTVVSHIRRLADIRQRFSALRRGTLIQLAAIDQMLAYARADGAQSVITVINNDTKPGAVQLDAAAAHFREGDQLRDLLGASPNLTVIKGNLWVKLGPRSAALYARLEP
jgi:glycosidase